MLSLFYVYLKIIAVVCLIAYPLTKNMRFKRALLMIPRKTDLLFLSSLFGAISILGNVLGEKVFEGGMIQSGMIGPVVGGIIAGPAVGISAGLIGGVHRIFYFGGFTSLPLLIAGIFAGVLGGLYYKRYGNNRFNFMRSCAVYSLAEMASLILILIFAWPSVYAELYMRMIAPISILANSLGSALFIMIIKDVQNNLYQTGSNYAEKALEIVNQISPVIKKGLTAATAKKISEVIYQKTEFNLVMITDNEKILAAKGVDTEHLPISFFTKIPQHEISINGDDSSIPVLISNKKEMITAKLSFNASIAVPLICNNQVVGYLKSYKSHGIINPPDVKMITGIASFLSLQLLSSKLEEQAKLLEKAEFDTLKAQINPHFLFNTLSAIKFLIRTNPTQAQDLILDLSLFLRKTLNRNEELMPFANEMEVIQLYLSIQKARFAKRLTIAINVQEACLESLFPPFALQQIVENSINHGFADEQLILQISAIKRSGFLVITVTDNGPGFPESIIEAVQRDDSHKLGIGLTNIKKRLQSLYGLNYSFQIRNLDQGARVELKIPCSMVQTHLIT